MNVELPAIRPDELLYSAIARGQCRLGASTHGIASRIFGHRKVVRPLFEHAFSWIARCLTAATGWQFDGERLLEDNTLYRAAAPSLPPNSALFRREALLEDVSGTSTLQLHRAICTPHGFTLRYCESCRRQDLDVFGEPYWHRSHQIPGLRICHRHQEPLVKTNAQADASCYISVSDALSTGREHVPASSEVLQRCLGRDLNWLIENQSQSFDRSRIAAACIKLASEKQYRLATPASLRSHILAKHSVDALKSINPSFAQLKWCNAFLGSRPNAILPVYAFIVTANSFGLSLKELVKISQSAKESESGPWPCLNPDCTHHGIAVISHYRLRDHHNYHAYFKCPYCTSIYRRSTPLKRHADGTFEVFSSSVRKPGSSERRDVHRNRLLAYGRGESVRVRQLNHSRYWLRWNDTVWFEANKPARRNTPRDKRADWTIVDAQWLASAQDFLPRYVEALKPNHPRPIKALTLKRALGNKEGKPFPGFADNKLPQTNAYIDSFTESRHAALQRRITAVTESIRKNHSSPSFSNFCLMCGVNVSQHPEYRAAVEAAHKALP